jgi:hypothetical protein
MVAVRNGLMSAFGAMTVLSIMRVAGVVWRAAGRILAAHFQPVVVHVTRVRTMQMAVMEVVRVAVMFDRRMAATGAMRVSMSFVNVMFRLHPGFSLNCIRQVLYVLPLCLFEADGWPE